MSSKLDRLLEIGVGGEATEVSRGRKAKHPAGWTPGVQLGAEGGHVVTEPRAEAPQNWDDILHELLPPGFDYRDYEVDGDTVEVRAWDSGDERKYYFKARIRKKGVDVAGVDLSDIVDVVKKARIAAPKPVDVERVYWMQITDLQAGQADGRGVEGMVERALQLGDMAREDVKRLNKLGTPVSAIFIPITGDLVEGVSGWYDMQSFSVELDRRQQVKLVRRLLTEVLTAVASLGLPVHVAVVPGNHGEYRQNGKAFTTLGDNDDVAVVEQIAEAFAFSDKMQHVTFSFPSHERLSLTVEVLGWVVGLTHGHVARGGNGTEQKITGWFKSMAATRDPIGDSDILFTGHYHHYRSQQLIGDTWWVQGGALCDASAWFSQTAGLVSDPVIVRGTITREQKLESVMPYAWARTKVEAKVI